MTSPSVQVLRAQVADAEAFAAHYVRQMKEPGAEGGLCHPFSPDHLWSEEEQAQKFAALWSLPELSPHWHGTWILEDHGRIVGHLHLWTSGLATEAHRIKMGMGIEQAYRGQGYGRALLATAVLWARNRARLSWIDLQVFSSNQRAVQLYRRFGFEELGSVSDAFRYKGESITNILMSLRLD